MRINFVTEPKKDSWILRPICEEYQRLIRNSTITDLLPLAEADVNIFVNYRLYKDCPTKTIGYFTHKEDSQWDEVAKRVDYCIGMSNYSVNLLPKGKARKIEPGAFFQYQRDFVSIGWVGREYSTGRKRSEWLNDLAKIEGVKIFPTNGQVPFENMPDYYASIDYLLITAEVEGGPIPMKEAIAMGVPVIAPKGVGWCDDYPSYRYETYEELENLIKGLVYDKETWVKGAREIEGVCKELLGSNIVTNKK